MSTLNDPAAEFFVAHYILWVVGVLELEMEEQLDAMSMDWKRSAERFCPWSRNQLRSRFNELCEIGSDEESLDVLFEEVGFVKS